MSESKKDKQQERFERLAEQYGKEKAEEMIRMEQAPGLGGAHQPPDQGTQATQVRTAMKEPERRATERGGRPAEPDADSHRKEHRETAEEAAEQAKKKRTEKEPR
ncbi:MAG: hypothetical protein GF401_16170 [Chitinivibrionales bacterium]|nr:hypothetical protein [Chitinivibrionales bacterium]